MILQCLRDGKCIFCALAGNLGQVLDFIATIHLEAFEGFPKVLEQTVVLGCHVGE